MFDGALGPELLVTSDVRPCAGRCWSACDRGRCIGRTTAARGSDPRGHGGVPV